jgi:hypothetical protein
MGTSSDIVAEIVIIFAAYFRLLMNSQKKANMRLVEPALSSGRLKRAIRSRLSRF